MKSLQLLSLVPFASALALTSKARAPSFPVQLQISSDLCLTAASNTDGASVYVAQCELDLANRGWNITNGGSSTGTGPATTITVFGNKCLDVKDGANNDGTQLQVWTCAKGNTNQMWNVNSDGSIRWAGTNKCMDNTGGILKDGNPVQIWTCSTGNPHQTWSIGGLGNDNPRDPGQTTGFRIQSPINPDNGCLAAVSNTNNAKVIVDKCNLDSANQKWNPVAGSSVSGKGPVGQLQIFGDKCLDVTNGVDASGTKLQIYTCAKGNTNQMWQINGDLTIGWAGHSRCVDLTNGNQTNGNQLQIWSCTQFNPSQQWARLALEDS